MLCGFNIYSKVSNNTVASTSVPGNIYFMYIFIFMYITVISASQKPSEIGTVTPSILEDRVTINRG